MNKFGLGLSLILLFSARPAGADTCGQLAGVRGNDVEILRVQRGRKVNDEARFMMKISESSSTPLECDDIVVAGKDSSARILLADAKLSLGSESRIEIASHSGAVGGGAGAESHVSLLNLTYGKLRALVNRKKDASGNTVVGGLKSGVSVPSKNANDSKSKVSFEIKTFSAVAGVRGTDFFVSYDPNAGVTQQATIEGSVEVTQSGTLQKVLVEGGRQVAVETTPQAVRKEQDRIKPPGQKSAAPKDFKGMNEPVKPLQVVAINDVTREELREASAAVAKDSDFTSNKAVEIIGQPGTWTLRREPLPDSLKKYKNEY
jgi:hypothetical protein